MVFECLLSDDESAAADGTVPERRSSDRTRVSYFWSQVPLWFSGGTRPSVVVVYHSTAETGEPTLIFFFFFYSFSPARPVDRRRDRRQTSAAGPDRHDRRPWVLFCYTKPDKTVFLVQRFCSKLKCLNTLIIPYHKVWFYLFKSDRR